MAKLLVVCLLLELCSLMLVSNAMSTSNPCNFRPIRSGVCVCNATYCDTLDAPVPVCGEYILVTSSKDGKRFDIIKSNSNTTSNETLQTNRRLEIDGNTQFQRIIGFGGALTDSSSSIIDSMDVSLQQWFYMSYISDTLGANYGILRIPLGASDFSDKPWAYHEQPEGDPLISNMTELYAYDRRRIQQIKEMEFFAPKDSKLKLMLCAWSPPPWMKSNKRWNGLSRLRPEYYSTWALYHVKALNLWKNEGLDFWSVSTGNEPTLSNIVKFLSLGWRPNDQKRWVSTYLRPMLNDQGYSDIRILGVDDQRSALFRFTGAYERSRQDPHLIDIDMIGLHWYLDNLSDPNWIDKSIKRYDIPVLYSEICEGAGLNFHDMTRGPILGSWSRCQEYVRKFINNLNHGTSGFIDWNLVLDPQGGPNYGEFNHFT